MNSDKVNDSLREEIRKKLLNLITNMDFSRGTKIPSENWLTAKFQVSRSTIRSVLNELEIEGKVIRKQGSGTYVNTHAFLWESTLYPRIGIREIIRKNGYQDQSKFLSIEHHLAGSFAGKLGCNSTAPIQEIHSLYYADEVPCMYCIDRIVSGLVTDEEWYRMMSDNQSIYKTLQRRGGIEVCSDRMRIHSVCTDEVPEVASCLFDATAPRSIVYLEIITYDNQSCPILYGNIYVNEKLINLSLNRDLSKL